MSDSKVFFEEMQSEFLIEADFMMDQYEESMLHLESGSNSKEDLTQIFRVAHSIKGGASAVGFLDLASFSHVVEDLLAILRVSPELSNSEIISLLLESGDALKKRIVSLKENKNEPWDTLALVGKLKASLKKLTNNQAHAEVEAKQTISQAATEDNTNYDLLAELEAKFGIPQETEAPVAVMPIVDLIPEVVFPLESSPEPVAQAVSETPKLNVVASAPASAPSTSPAASAKTSKAAPAKSSTAQQASQIKVDTVRIDSVLDAVGEIVVLKNQLIHDEGLKVGINPHLSSIIDLLDKSVRDLYDKALGMRMTPLKSLFLKTQRIVRDVSLQLGKPVNLKILGEDTEVERTVFEILGDPMTHLVRNALDHGVEKEELRRSRGKNPTASVTVSAKQKGGHVVIDIIDDGGGIDRKKIISKIVEKGIIGPDVNTDKLSDEEVFQYIFAPGFSTAEKVTDLSGRGVGLDVVRSNLDKIQGKIHISSELGKGTTFSLIIPLSTAITDGIVVMIHGHNFILPIHSIKEIVMVEEKDFTYLSDTHKMARIREFLVPVINLDEFLKTLPTGDGESSEGHGFEENHLRLGSTLVMVETPVGFVAMPVDKVIGQTQVVVKPFQVGAAIPEISGAAVLGDGSTVLIFDPVALATSQMKTNQTPKMNSEFGEVAA